MVVSQFLAEQKYEINGKSGLILYLNQFTFTHLNFKHDEIESIILIIAVDNFSS